MKKEHKLLEARTVNALMKDLDKAGNEGWSIALYVQEFGVTKVIMERETK